MELTTLPRVKDRLSVGANDSQYDDVLERMIRAASAKVEAYIRRQVLKGTTTEYFDVAPGQELFPLKAYPVTSITTVHNDADRAYGSSTLMAADTYTVDTDTGLLYVEGAYLITGIRALKVVYIGGMAATTSAFVATQDYSNIVDATERQVCFLFNMRGKEGQTAISAATGNVTWIGSTDLTDGVKKDLDDFRRVIL
jgi:hypothetical protein